MATELAKAYVQIIPSAQGIKEAIREELGGEAEKTGASFGQKLASSIKGAISIAGIGAVLAKSITEGANLQQSIGGIETLFKSSASVVKGYAEQAYATAGISANSYMEQVTSFSAQLLQSLGGDTAKSAEVANMAIVDMSDNCNKMGTSIELIQHAYQGFARGSYVMLDNLKLGYGGTKAEMERLLADAQKLSGVKYDINNLSDVYNAIHVIQQELGITGTTAKEATTTLIGSFGAMKSAFSNLMGNMALGENLTKNIQQLLSTTSTFLFGNLIPMIGNVALSIPQIIGQAVPMMLNSGLEMATSLSNGLKTGIPQAVGAVMDMIGNVANWIVQQAPIVAQSGVQIVTNLAQGIISAVPVLITNASKIVTEFISGVRQALPQMIASGGELINNLITGIVGAIPSLVSSLQTLLTDVLSLFSNLEWLATLNETFLTVGTELITNLINGIVTALPLLVEGATTLVTTFLQFLTTNLPMILQMGVQWIQQLIQGIITALPTLAQGVVTLITSFVQFINQNLPQILQAGLQLIQQLVSGILQAIPQLISAIPQLISAFVQTLMAYDWLGLGVQVIQCLGNGVVSMVGFIGDCAGTIVQTVIDWINQLPAQLLELGAQAIQNLGEGIASVIGDIATKAQEIYDTIIDKVGEIVGEAVNIGSNFVHGLWDGISGAAGWLWDQVTSFCDSIVQGVKDFFRIGSPSKMMRDEVGQWLPKGMAVGIDANADSVTSAMQRLQDDAMGVFDMSAHMATQKYVFEREDMSVLSVIESIVNDLKAQGYTLNRLYDLLAELLPDFNSLQLVTDTGALVGEIAEQMDEKLGTFNRRKER